MIPNLFISQKSLICYKPNLFRHIPMTSWLDKQLHLIFSLSKKTFMIKHKKEQNYQHISMTYYPNESDICLSKNQMFYEGTKPINIRLHFIKDIIA